MGFQLRLRTPGRRVWANLSKSGVSLSARAGRLTVNSRGTWWFRICKGLFYRSTK